MRLTRKYRFAASHRLHAPALSDAENRAIFGKCNNPYGHGHNYVLEVTVAGRPAADSGLLVDRDRLDALVERRILAAFRHADLNQALPGVPTTEHLLTDIRDRLRRNWNEEFADTGPHLEKIRLHETRRNIFQVDGHA